MSAPREHLMFLDVGQGQQYAVVAGAPQNAVGRVLIGPGRERAAPQQMGRPDGQIVAHVAVHIVAVGQIAHGGEPALGQQDGLPHDDRFQPGRAVGALLGDVDRGRSQRPARGPAPGAYGPLRAAGQGHQRAQRDHAPNPVHLRRTDGQVHGVIVAGGIGTAEIFVIAATAHPYLLRVVAGARKAQTLLDKGRHRGVIALALEGIFINGRTDRVVALIVPVQKLRARAVPRQPVHPRAFLVNFIFLRAGHGLPADRDHGVLQAQIFTDHGHGGRRLAFLPGLAVVGRNLVGVSHAAFVRGTGRSGGGHARGRLQPGAEGQRLVTPVRMTVAHDFGGRIIGMNHVQHVGRLRAAQIGQGGFDIGQSQNKRLPVLARHQAAIADNPHGLVRKQQSIGFRGVEDKGDEPGLAARAVLRPLVACDHARGNTFRRALAPRSRLADARASGG